MIAYGEITIPMSSNRLIYSSSTNESIPLLNSTGNTSAQSTRIATYAKQRVLKWLTDPCKGGPKAGGIAIKESPTILFDETVHRFAWVSILHESLYWHLAIVKDTIECLTVVQTAHGHPKYPHALRPAPSDSGLCCACPSRDSKKMVRKMVCLGAFLLCWKNK